MPRFPSLLEKSSFLRFALVGATGELIYLILFALVARAGGSSPLAIGIAGGTCLVLNSFLHARVSFRVAFELKLFLQYLAIQSFCLLAALFLGWLMDRYDVSQMVTGLASWFLWTGISFPLTRWAYRRRVLANQKGLT